MGKMIKLFVAMFVVLSSSSIQYTVNAESTTQEESNVIEEVQFLNLMR